MNVVLATNKDRQILHLAMRTNGWVDAHNKPTEEARAILRSYGYESRTQITAADYPKILKYFSTETRKPKTEGE